MKLVTFILIFFSIGVESQTNSPIGLWKVEASNGDTSSFVQFNKNGTMVQNIYGEAKSGVWKVKKNKFIIRYSKTYKRILNAKGGLDFEEDLDFYSKSFINGKGGFIRKEYLKPSIDKSNLVGRKSFNKTKSIDKWLSSVDTIVVEGDAVIQFQTNEFQEKSIDFCENGDFYYANAIGYWNVNDRYLTLSCHDWNGWWFMSSKTWEILSVNQTDIILREVCGRKQKLKLTFK